MTQQGPPLESMYDVAPAAQPAPSRSSVEDAGPPPAPESVDPYPQEFPDGHREAFTGLMLLGKLEHYFTWAGHRFRIQTCRPYELAEASRWAARYAGTDGYVKAYQAGILAACLISIDGKPLPVVPLTEDDTAIEGNADWVLRKLFPPTLDKVHEEYILLEIKAREILDAMGKASG